MHTLKVEKFAQITSETAQITKSLIRLVTVMRRQQSNVKDLSIKKKLTREFQVEQNDRMYHKTLESCSFR